MVWTVQDTVAIIPYYSGEEGYHRGSKAENRLNHLIRTLKSLEGLATRIVYVCSDNDYKTVSNLSCEGLEMIRTDNPRYLIHYMCEDSQEKYNDYKFLLYTDSDHEFTINKESFNDFDNKYYVPHRFEEVVNGKGADRGLRVGDYVIVNHSPPGLVTSDNDAYSGSYICKKEDFNKVSFLKTLWLTGEQGAGLNIFNSGLPCYKLPIDDFKVEHLSGRDYHEGL